MAWYLAQSDPQRSPLDARTVLIVDEASTLGYADLHQLLQRAQSAGAAVRLIGDPAQHGAVAAGGMFRVLCEQHPALTPQLTENRRLQHAGDLAAVEALRDGHIEDALAQLEAASHLHLAADDLQLYARLLARWWEACQNGSPHPLVERSNHRRRQLNRLARRGSRHLHPDGDRAAYLRDGRIDAGIDHSYAVTSYAVQGATFEESTGRVDERTSRAEVYVDLTRGRRANHLYATRAEDPLDGERLPKAPPPPLDAALTIRLRASGAEVTACELDPHAAGRIDRQEPGRSLA